MRYDLYDKDFSYGIPRHPAVDEQQMLILKLTKPELIVVNEGEKCPPEHPDLAEIYAKIKENLRQANIRNKLKEQQ